jgi:ribosomal protein S18 acetylase RimI-like enzyme
MKVNSMTMHAGRATRYATEKDIPEIVRIINAAFRVEDFFVNGDRTSYADISNQMADPHVRFLVVDADEPGTLAAAVVVDVHDGRGHFAMLSVDPPLQGRGLARILMQAIEDYCREAGCDTVEIEVVNLREELPAFYDMMGYAPTDTAPFPDKGKLRRDAHMVRMTKRLSASDSTRK